MAYRNNNRRNGGGGNFGNNYGAGRINPWDTGVGGGRANNDALTLANSLINNLLRNQNSNQVPPSLLDGVQSSRFDDMNGFNFIRVSANVCQAPLASWLPRFFLQVSRRVLYIMRYGLSLVSLVVFI